MPGKADMAGAGARTGKTGRASRLLRGPELRELLGYKDQRPVLDLFKGAWMDAGETFLFPGRGGREYAITEDFFLRWLEGRRVRTKGGSNGC